MIGNTNSTVYCILASFKNLRIQAVKFVDVVNCFREYSCFQDIYHLFNSKINVTRSHKKGLIAHNRKSIFFTQIQSYMNSLFDFSVRHGL